MRGPLKTGLGRGPWGWRSGQPALVLTIQVLQDATLGNGELLRHGLQLLGKHRPSGGRPSSGLPPFPSRAAAITATLQQGQSGARWKGPSALTCPGLAHLPVLTWGISDTRSRRLSSVSGTASTLGPVCSCTRWLVTKAQTTPILWDGGRRRDSQDVLGRLGLSPPVPPDPGTPHSSTRVVSSRKVMRVPRSQASSLCSVFTGPPQDRWPRQQQKQSPAVGTTRR